MTPGLSPILTMPKGPSKPREAVEQRPLTPEEIAAYKRLDEKMGLAVIIFGVIALAVWVIVVFGGRRR